MQIKLFRTLPKEAAKIREEVFVKEQQFKEEFDRFEDSAYHFVMFDGGEAVATCRMLKEENDRYHIGRVAVIKSRRGQGLGRLVIEAAEETAKELGGKSILIGAQIQAKGFYAALGYTAKDDIYYEEHCPHVEMTKLI